MLLLIFREDPIPHMYTPALVGDLGFIKTAAGSQQGERVLNA